MGTSPQSPGSLRSSRTQSPGILHVKCFSWPRWIKCLVFGQVFTVVSTWTCLNRAINARTPPTTCKLGPLRTWAKSRDHRGSPKKVSKGHPNTPPKSRMWSRILKCNVKSYGTGPSTKCYFNEFPVMRVLLAHDKKRINQRLWAFQVPWSPGRVLGLPPTSGFWK
jgi:hypothetical protein